MRRRRIRAAIVLALAAVLAFVAWRGWYRPPRPASPDATAADTVSAGIKAARLYFASAGGDSLVSEAREMVETQSLHDKVAGLVAELDRGPSKGGVAALPAGTVVLHVYLDDRGLMTLDLSRAFQQGFRGGSGGEYLAITSLVRTIGSNVPEAKRLLIVCGGAQIATLGGHFPLDRPIEIAEWP